MTARTSPARRAAFFAALAATGNQTIAAERAKVSRSWVTLHRASDPAFRLAMDEAIAAARAQLAQAGALGPGAGWRSQGGEELLVRGSNGRLAQVARARIRQWTPRVEARFLAALARSCNVKAACAAVGLSQASAYNHRRRWNDFAERWDAALTAGYETLETAMIRSAGAMLGDPDWRAELGAGSEPVIPVATVDEAIRLMKLHSQRVHGLGRMPGRQPLPPSMAEMRPRILKKLQRFARMLEREEAKREAGRGGGRKGARG